MITCKNAQQLFDRYLDGELSSSLQAELHAHRLNCSECQQDLAIFEACGDVVRMDTREPRLDSSFTNRVMLGYAVRRRSHRPRWQRIATWAGTGLAAAASITLAVIWMLPSSPPNLPSITAGAKVAVSEPAKEFLTAKEGTQLTDAAKAELDATPQMGAANFTSLLTPIVKRARSTFANARRGSEELQMLLQMGISTARESVDVAAPVTGAQESSRPSAFDPAMPVLDPFGPDLLQESTDSPSSNYPNAL
jgi:hypothetical protein